MQPTRIADGIIALVLIEGVVLLAYRRRTGRGVPSGEIASFLGAGLALLVALRLVASGAGMAALAGVLLAALLLHIWHLAGRWER